MSAIATIALLTSSLALPTADAQEPTRKARSTTAAPTRAKPTMPLARNSGAKTNPRPLEQLREDLTKVLRGRHLLRGTTAVYAVDAESGEVLFATNEKKRLNPASNVKLFSTAAVLDILGDEFRFHTRLIGALPDKDGVIDGDVYMLGSGDPTLLSEEVDDLARALVARGVVKIVGGVSISDDLYRDVLAVPGIRIAAVGSRRAGKAPSVSYSPVSDFVEIVVRAKTSNSRRARLQASGRLVTKDGAQKWIVTVTGGVRRGARRSLHIAAPLRSTFSAHVVRSALIRAGIEVTGQLAIEDFSAYVARSTDAGRLPIELATHQSAPMSKLVRRVNKYSINYLADRLVMTAAAQEGNGKLSMPAAVQTMHRFFDRVGIKPDKLTIDTGSGLSYNTKLTAEQIVKILRVGAGYEPGSRGTPESFTKSLAVAGVDGTLRGRLKGSGVAGHVIGKTGTLTSCLALSGFVTAEDGRTIAFAIVTNGNRRRDRGLVRSEHEVLIEAIHRYSKSAPPPQPESEPTAELADDELDALEKAAGDIAPPAPLAP